MERLLEEHGVKPTPNRLLVARALAGSHHRPLSLKELEERLETIDKSNIFRALTVFREARLVHVPGTASVMSSATAIMTRWTMTSTCISTAAAVTVPSAWKTRRFRR